MGEIVNDTGIRILIVCFSVLVLASAATEDVLRVKRASKPPQCRDRFEIIPNHTMCISQTRGLFNKTVQANIADLHNNVRQNVKPSASNMMKVAYIRTLEIEAQTWADNCQFHHDDPHRRFIPGRYHVGQNILTSPGKDLSWSDVVHTWASENATFRYNKSGNDVTKVGNYIQMVWADTLLVGCGKAKCGTDYFYVCNYSPSMDVRRPDTPYEQSGRVQPAGQKCWGHHPSNSSTLCDCSGKYCTNGGKLDLATCNCTCEAGVSTYHPHICELTCTANGDHASCGSKTKQSCEADPQTAFLCPWLCDVCPYADMTYRENSVPMPWETTTTKTTTTTTTITTTTTNHVTPQKYRGSVASLSPSAVVIVVTNAISICVVTLLTYFHE